MNVVYLAQFYNEPDDPGAGRHFAFIRTLSELGHRVTVVTGQENYRTGRIPEKYRGHLIHREERDGCTILRTWVLTGHRRHFSLRYLNQLSFFLTGTLGSTRECRHADVVVASSPPLLVGAAGAVLSRKWRIPFVLDVRDLWPESVEALDVPVPGPVVRFGYRLADWIYARGAGMVAVTEGIRSGLMARGVPEEKIVHIPNGVDIGLYDTPPEPDPSLRAQLGLEGKFLCVYVGGIGPVHDVGTLVEAARHLGDEPRCHFLIVGDGPEKRRLVAEAQASGLRNVTFLDPVPKRRVPAVLATADLCVYSLKRNDFFRGTFPNKNFDYLASARPVVLAVEGESRRLVEAAGCGKVVPPADAGAMAAAIREMMALPAETRLEMGRRGRAYAFRNYHRRDLARRFVGFVEEVVQADSHRRMEARG
jgi:glycosyltransferase involved in cell wall biosynthesis